jgi:5,10-methylenetetrahydromethanopterin reductase
VGEVTTEPLPVLEDLSTYVLGGRVTDASIGIAEAVEAERLGLRRVWISERYNMKNAAVLFGAIAAATERIGVGTGAMTITARPPIVTASIGATVHSAFGPRCVLGLGLGTLEFNKPHGMPLGSYSQLVDYAEIMKRLFRGETINYSGPAGQFRELRFPDLYNGPSPQIWHTHMGGPKACAASANLAFDGAMVGFFATPNAVRDSVECLRENCERLGRDPESLHICVPVCTAPEVSPALMSSLVRNPSYGSGIVTRETLKVFLALFMTQPSTATGVLRRNGWDERAIAKTLEHPLFKGMGGDADFLIRDRDQALEAASLAPDEWIAEACAIGSTRRCVDKLEEFRAAGANEIALYTSSPGQNADVIAEWHKRREADLSANPTGKERRARETAI